MEKEILDLEISHWKKKLEEATNPIIIDVRTEKEYNDDKIKDSINIDFFSKEFKDKLNKLDKSKEYFVYCRSGGRSKMTMEIMEELGFNKVYNLNGGIIAWNSN